AAPESPETGKPDRHSTEAMQPSGSPGTAGIPCRFWIITNNGKECVMQSDTMTNVTGRPVEVDETNRLISSEKVDGTAVYNRQGDRLGTVHHLMIDKFTGQVEYAVMSF